jgi:glycerophosphoryl diester phosphodiesterase
MLKRIAPLAAVIVSLALIALSGTKADARQLFTFDDNQMPFGWQVGSGDWKVADGALHGDSTGGLATIFFGDDRQENHEITAKLTFTAIDNDSRWVSIIFRAGKDGATPWSQVPVRFKTTAKNGIEFAVRTGEDWDVRQTKKSSSDSRLDVPRVLRIVVKSTKVDAYLNGEHLISTPYCVERDSGGIGFAASGCKVRIDDVAVNPLPESETKFSQMERMPCAVIAHRGYSSVAPENTLAATREAIKVGATGCEFDVYVTKDGHVIGLHDATLNRTTNGTGRADEMMFEQIRTLDAGSWKDKKFAGEQVPTLEEMLTLLKQSDCEPVIEIKADGATQKVVDIVQRLGMRDDVSVISFDRGVISAIRKLDERIRCYWVVGGEPEGTAEEVAEWLASEAEKLPTKFIDLNYQMLSPELIAALKRRGLTVWCWTVNNSLVMDALMRWGIDGITTDYPEKALGLIRDK